MPDKVAAMYRTLQFWQKETAAAIPRIANPNYDPNAQRPRAKAGGTPSGQAANKGKGKGQKGPLGNN